MLYPVYRTWIKGETQTRLIACFHQFDFLPNGTDLKWYTENITFYLARYVVVFSYRLVPESNFVGTILHVMYSHFTELRHYERNKALNLGVFYGNKIQELASINTVTTGAGPRTGRIHNETSCKTGFITPGTIQLWTELVDFDVVITER